MQHLKQSYSDILTMPTYQRRFFLGLLTKDRAETQEHIEKMKEKSQTKTGKGTRQTRVSGSALKSKIQLGEIPNK